MRIKIFAISLFCSALFLSANAFAQGFQYKSEKRIIPYSKSVKPSEIKIDFQPKLEKIAPAPGGKEISNWLQEQKKLIVKRPTNSALQKTGAPKATMGNIAKPDLKFSKAGNFENLGSPCDNDIAISNAGILLSVVNSNILAYDTEADSLLFSVSLEAFADTLGLTAHMYDPRAIYDPLQDRFIMVWLSGNTDSTSNIVLAFSTDADPREAWHLYYLPGDPLEDDTWSDFPAVAITENELFISINALINDTLPGNQIDSWKYLFKETGLWQIDKRKGYSGQNLDTRYWNDFYFNGKSVRNLLPVKGGFSIHGPDMFFLSNRSFDLQNDSIFMAYLNGELNDPNLELSLKILKTNPAYGLPPDAIQRGARTLQTNDARILGAFLENGKIHYVQNTVLPDSATSSVYHGIISDVYTNPSIQGHIFSEGTMEFSYPNISFTGKNKYDEQMVISFNHVSQDTFAGFSAVFYKEGEGYSDRLSIKSGSGSVGSISRPRSRWGDYSGSQKKYNERGVVWMSGYYGLGTAVGGVNRTWISAVQSPDSSFNVGVFAPALKNKSKLFPNPVEDRFNVVFEMDKAQQVKIALYNVQGQLVQIFWNDGINAGEHNFSFSLADLSSGIYVLKGLTKSGNSIFSEKIIRN